MDLKQEKAYFSDLNLKPFNRTKAEHTEIKYLQFCEI